jgi:mannan endo-1,4-beta-mannosidase
LKAAPSSDEKTNYRNELNKVGQALKQLKQAGVMVLWRPFHEMNGAWFWWGPNDVKAPTNMQDYRALWKDMYETFTKDFGLDNLIWVYSPFGPEANFIAPVNAFYPGDKYVDMVALDVYPKSPQFQDYNVLKKLNKPVTNGEIGPSNVSFGSFDELELLKTLQGNTPYFLQWSSWEGAKVNIVENLHYKEMMNNPAAITLDKIK